jgi:hypothetical protein
MTRREFITLMGRAAAWPLVVALPAGAAQKLPRLCVVTVKRHRFVTPPEYCPIWLLERAKLPPEWGPDRRRS